MGKIVVQGVSLLRLFDRLLSVYPYPPPSLKVCIIVKPKAQPQNTAGLTILENTIPDWLHDVFISMF
jgi:hypothetical protein